MTRRRILISLMIVFAIAQSANARYYTNESTPQRIIINLTATPASSMAVTWRTADEIKNPVVQIAEATDWTEFLQNVRSIKPKSKKFITNENITSKILWLEEELKTVLSGPLINGIFLAGHYPLWMISRVGFTRPDFTMPAAVQGLTFGLFSWPDTNLQSLYFLDGNNSYKK